MPKSRIETLLEALLNGETVDIEPQSRVEAYLLALINGDTDVSAPRSRNEAYLYALCKKGMGGSNAGGDMSRLLDRTITEIDDDTITNIGEYACYECTALVSVNLPNVLTVPGYTFRYCSALKTVKLPKATSIDRYAFSNCSNLDTLVLCRTGDITTLKFATAFGNTPFASGGTGGKVYVPAALIETYKTATNWSTLYEAGTCTFVAIEGSEYE